MLRIGALRRLSIAAARSLPTRHSRHLPPPMAKSLEEALEYHKNLTETTSSWYTYPTSFLKETDDSLLVQQLADPYLQQVEYTLRGISSTLPHSIHSNTTTTSTTSNSTVQERVEQMIALLERAEHESHVMCQLRANYKSQISSSLEDDGEESAEWRRLKIQQSFGIHPGLSVDMYDIVLDAIAVSASSLPEAPSMAFDILQRVLDKTTTTTMMVPTPLTFNAVLRAAAASSTSVVRGSKEHEVLLECATSAFTRMQQPNAASYVYMMQIIANTFPQQKSLANMLYGLYTQACQHGVLSQQVQSTFQTSVQFDSDYHSFVQAEKDKIIPQKYTRNIKQYSYTNDSNSTY